jgi:peptidoglycan/LPS O-acetylase OafA/YrhL
MVYTSEPLFGRRQGPLIFMGRRILRIVPLYWFLTLSIVTGWLVYFGAVPGHASILSSLLFWPNENNAPVLGVGWTLNYEMFFYAMFAMTVFLPRTLSVIALTCLFFVFTHLPFSGPPMNVWGSDLVWEFVYGLWMGLAFRAGWRIPPAPAIVISILAYATALYLFNHEWGGLPRSVAWGVPAAVIVGAFAMSRFDFGKLPGMAPLVALGDASYALYLLHSIVPIFMRVGHVPSVIDPVQHGYLYATISVTLSLIAAFIFNELDRRFRFFVRRSRGPSDRSRPSTGSSLA